MDFRINNLSLKRENISRFEEEWNEKKKVGFLFAWSSYERAFWKRARASLKTYALQELES